MTTVEPLPLLRVRLADLVASDGAPTSTYLRAVEALSGSLTKHNAAIIELGTEDAALMRCGLEAARFYFRTKSAHVSSGSKGVYIYRATGRRDLEDWNSSPACMADTFRCMGKAARIALSAIAKYLRLRSDVFNHLLDDYPLSANEASSSVLVATYSALSRQCNKGPVEGCKPYANGEVEKGLLTLVSSDSPGFLVCDPNNRWYLADDGSEPGDLLLLTGKCLSHATAGLRPAASYRADCSSSTANGGRASLVFRLTPRGNAILDCSSIAAAGHVIPQSYVPISVGQFMDELAAEEDIMCNHSETTYVSGNNLNGELSLRSVLSDPLSGAFLEDAMLVPCGHSFGGLLLRKVMDTSRCSLCGADIESNCLIPNHALRAAAAAVKHEDDKRLFHNAALHKRRKELGDQRMEFTKRQQRGDGDVAAVDKVQKEAQYPFDVNEKVVIKGNRRTADKFVGKEAIITSQCLNGWYSLKVITSGENISLQYRSLQKVINSQAIDERHLVQSNQEK